MKKYFRSFAAFTAVLLISLGVISHISKPAFAMGVTFGTQVGKTVTYVNNTDQETQGYINYFATTSKQGALIASPNAISFTCGEHVTWKYVTRKFGYRWITSPIYVFDGYNLFLNVPAQSIVTVQESLTLPVTTSGVVCLKNR